MQEFTVRNKATRPIMKLSQAMLAKMLTARPESVSLVLAKMVKDYKEITGKALSLDHDQQQALLSNAGADALGMWTNRYSQLPHPVWQLRPIFSDGFLQRQTSSSLSEDLELAECFHALLDAQLST